MAASFEQMQQFIELRAENVSYAKIAKQIGVSKTTLIDWAKNCELEIENRRAVTLEALNEQYKVGQQHRLQMWSEQLEAVRAELKTRGLADVPTVKLIEMLDILSEKLKAEAYDWRFKSKPVTKPYEVELLTSTHQDTWQG
jgi:intein-encoded DNA endonuclease-like protein